MKAARRPDGGPRRRRGFRWRWRRSGKRMQELQAQSDEVRQEYASGATFAPVRPADPPFKAPTARRPRVAAAAQTRGARTPTGDPAAMAQKMAESLGGAAAARGFTTGRRRRRRIAIGRWIARGGGSPGAAPGGAPVAPTTGTPKLPTDPSLRPAAACRWRRIRRRAPGRRRGVGAAVARGDSRNGRTRPTHAGRRGSRSREQRPAARRAGDGRRMAPMHGAQGGAQGKEKRRDPRTAPDEDLYTEDRPWTEGVVGNRRRKEVQDGKQGGTGRPSDRRDASGGRRRPAAGGAVAVTDG